MKKMAILKVVMFGICLILAAGIVAVDQLHLWHFFTQQTTEPMPCLTYFFLGMATMALIVSIIYEVKAYKNVIL